MRDDDAFAYIYQLCLLMLDTSSSLLSLKSHTDLHRVCSSENTPGEEKDFCFCEDFVCCLGVSQVPSLIGN